MQEREPRVKEEHPGARKSHHLADARPHRGGVTVDGASCAGGLILLVGTFVNPLQTVLIKLLAVIAQAGGRAVIGATKNLDHGTDGALLSF
jgi:hypothetical protein